MVLNFFPGPSVTLPGQYVTLPVSPLLFPVSPFPGQSVTLPGQSVTLPGPTVTFPGPTVNVVVSHPLCDMRPSGRLRLRPLWCLRFCVALTLIKVHLYE